MGQIRNPQQHDEDTAYRAALAANEGRRAAPCAAQDGCWRRRLTWTAGTRDVCCGVRDRLVMGSISVAKARITQVVIQGLGLARSGALGPATTTADQTGSRHVD